MAAASAGPLSMARKGRDPAAAMEGSRAAVPPSEYVFVLQLSDMLPPSLPSPFSNSSDASPGLTIFRGLASLAAAVSPPTSLSLD